MGSSKGNQGTQKFEGNTRSDQATRKAGIPGQPPSHLGPKNKTSTYRKTSRKISTLQQRIRAPKKPAGFPKEFFGLKPPWGQGGARESTVFSKTIKKAESIVPPHRSPYRPYRLTWREGGLSKSSFGFLCFCGEREHTPHAQQAHQFSHS